MTLEIGSEIDGFRLLDVLGRGGMGVVYRAEDVALSRDVALKLIDPQLAGDDAFLRRFRTEARALARIDSPYIVRIHALRQAGSLLFIVMEYVDGGTLAEGPRPLDLAAARRPALETMRALEHAHGVGVVHRDIKPNNLMVTRAGGIKVADFGLATVRQRNAAATVTQAVAGTLWYMSPEQVRGLATLDHRTDLYSLGMTIYEMLAGRLPFDRDRSEFAVMRTIVEETLPPLSHFRRDVPPALDAALTKALAKDPEARFASAAEMRLAFEAAFDAATGAPRATPKGPAGPGDGRGPDPAPAPPPGPGGRLRRHGLSLAAAAVLVVALGAAWWWGVRGTSADGSEETTAAVPALAAPLTVRTTPPGAAVFVDGRAVGAAPVTDVPVAGSSATVRVELDGYAPLDTVIAAQDGAWAPLALRLTPEASPSEPPPPEAPARGGLTVASEPSGAAVFVDGRRRGTTPLTLSDVAPGERALRLELDGYAPWTGSARVEAGGTRRVDAPLRVVSAPAPAATGIVRVRAEPEGAAYVGDARAGAGGVTVPAGTATVRCGDGPGAATRTVDVDAGAVVELTCYFAHPVNIQSVGADGVTAVWGSVYIDGRQAGEYTPWTTTLGTGEYTIMVAREGFVTLDEAETVRVRPAFERVPYQVVFRLRPDY